jgi:hypothetical protein
MVRAKLSLCCVQTALVAKAPEPLLFVAFDTPELSLT